MVSLVPRKCTLSKCPHVRRRVLRSALSSTISTQDEIRRAVDALDADVFYVSAPGLVVHKGQLCKADEIGAATLKVCG